MILCLTGAIDGHIDPFYNKLFALESQHKVQTDWVLCVGSFGVWPDPTTVDRQTREHKGFGDFAHYYVNQKPVPRPTLFVAGPHEDHNWMQWRASNQRMELLPNLSWLMNGYRTTIGTTKDQLTIVGLGKTYSPKYYNMESSANHYTKRDIQKSNTNGKATMILSHEAPKGLKFNNIVSESWGISTMIKWHNPKLFVHGHYNCSKAYKIGNNNALSLDKREIKLFAYENNLFTKVY